MGFISISQTSLIKKIIKRFNVIDGEVIKISIIDQFNEDIFFKIDISNGENIKSYLLRFLDKSDYDVDKLNNDFFIKSLNEYLNNDFCNRLVRVSLKGEDDKYYYTNSSMSDNIACCYEFKKYYMLKNIRDINDIKKYGRALGYLHLIYNYYDEPIETDKILKEHNTSEIYIQFLEAIVNYSKNNNLQQLPIPARECIDYIIENKDIYSTIIKLINENKILIMLIHNNIKINNFLLDENENVQDVLGIENVGYGSVLFDIAQVVIDFCSIYYDKSKFNIDYYNAFISGYKNVIALLEIEEKHLKDAIIIMALENAMLNMIQYLINYDKCELLFIDHYLKKAHELIKFSLSVSTELK